MKSFGLLCCGLFWAISAQAEIDSLWTRIVPLNPNSYQLDVAAMLQSGDAMIGSLQSDGGTVGLIRLSADGETAWEGSVQIPAQYPQLLGLEQFDEGHLMLISSFQTEDSAATLHLKGMSASGADLWEASYEYPVLSYLAATRKLADNTVILYGTSYSGVGGTASVLIKIDSDGDTLWSHAIGGVNDNVQTYDVEELSNGDLVLAGALINASGYFEGFVTRTTSQGVQIWSNTYSAEDENMNLFCTSLDVSSSDDILVGGSTGNFWWTSYPWAVSLTEDGDAIWTIDSPVDLDGGIVGVRYTLGGGALMVATTVADFGFSHAKVIVADGSGAATLGYTVEGMQGAFYGLRNDGTRGAVAYGSITDENWNYQGYVLRIGPSTSVTGFVRELDSNQPVEGARVEMLETGDVAFTDVQGIYSLGLAQTVGTLRVSSPCITPQQREVEIPEGEQSTENFTVGVPIFQNGVSSLNMVATFNIAERDTVILSNFGNGDLVYSTTVHEQSPTYGWLSVAPTGGVIPPNGTAELVVTVLALPEHPEAEFFGEVHVHHNSCPDTVNEIGVFVLALDSPERPAPVSEFAVQPAYPNPFNGTTSVRFDIPVESDVQLDVFDIQGRLTKSIAASRFAAGNHVAPLDLRNQATGVYLLRVQAAENVSVQKIIFLK